MFWRDKNQTNTLCHNSMSPIPKTKFLNLARIIREHDDDVPNIKSYKQNKQLEDYYKYGLIGCETYYDKFNH